MTKVSLQTLDMFVLDFVPCTGISYTSPDWELNADKLWHTAALIYVDNGRFAITAIDEKLRKSYIPPFS